ncbi:MAG: TolC family protein [Candidatus Omnitrophota bacterium]
MNAAKQIKRFLVIFTLVCGCFLFPCSALAESQGEDFLALDMDKAIEMALAASEDLKLQDNEVFRKRSEQKEEASYLFPKVMGEAGWSNNFEYPDIAETAAVKDYSVNAGVTVSQTLFTFGRISNAISAARKAFEASRFDRDGTKQEVIYNAKIAFYNTQLAEKVLKIAEESYTNVLQNKEILESRAAVGRVSKYDNIKISADIAARKPAVNNARADFASAMESLKVVIGADSKVSLSLADNFKREYPEYARQDLALALYHNQPAIKALAKNIEQKEALIRSKKATLLPEVSAFATWNHKGDSDDYYIGGDNLNDYGVAGFKVSVPIWVGGIDREKLYQAKIDKNDAELKYKQGQEQYLLMLDNALNEYREYKKTLEANEEALRLAGESFRYSQELFGSGQVSVTDLNDAELQLTNAKLNKEMTLFNLNKALAVIERLTLMENNDE